MSQIQLSPEDEARVREIILMVQQSVTPTDKVTQRGPETVAILANTLLGLSQMASRVASRYGIHTQVPMPHITPLEWRG